MDAEFAALRAASEHNLVQFLQTELALCSTLIGLGETEHDIGNVEAAKRSIQHAEEGYATMMRFLSDPKHSQFLSPKDLLEFTDAVTGLRTRLDGVRLTR